MALFLSSLLISLYTSLFIFKFLLGGDGATHYGDFWGILKLLCIIFNH